MSYRSKGGVQTNKGITIADPRFSLLFPSNIEGADQSAPFVTLQFDDPQDNGLPIWGPGNAGTTWIWEYTPIQQEGYYVTFWWSNNGNFLWDGGSSDTYYGCHPYPQPPTNQGVNHAWETAGMGTGGDHINTLAGGPKTVVKDGTRYLQGFRVTHNGSTKTSLFYTSLPSVANADVIQADAPSDFGNTDPPLPAITFGDSPWFASFQHERMSGYLGRVKIFAIVLSVADMILEAASMNSLVTAAGLANIWWGKKGFRFIDDLTCDYGTGRSFHWADDSNKATMGLLIT